MYVDEFFFQTFSEWTKTKYVVYDDMMLNIALTKVATVTIQVEDLSAVIDGVKLNKTLIEKAIIH